MANNIFVSYDLHQPGRNYHQVIERIKQLGLCAKPLESMWYVKTEMTAKQVRDYVWAGMDGNDSLLVVDATNNDAAWQNIKPEAAQAMRDLWSLAKIQGTYR